MQELTTCKTDPENAGYTQREQSAMPYYTAALMLKVKNLLTSPKKHGK